MRGIFTIILAVVTAGFITSCAEENVSPTFPDVVMPTILISGVSDSDTGAFASSAGNTTVQSFDLTVDAVESIFPECDIANTSVSISDETNFTLTYSAGSSTFSVSPNQINESSADLTATVTAEVDASYGGGVSQLIVTQAKADIPSFITQPTDVTFAKNFSQGSTATTSFVIDPASVTDITTSSFSITENIYYYTTITEMSDTEWGYTVTFYATIDAVNAISSAGDEGISLSCMITINYDDTSFEQSDIFTITMPK